MNANDKIKELNDELRALKSTFSMSAYNLVIYTYELDPIHSGSDDYEITFITEDGADAIAAIENVYARRVPFNGGAKWKVSQTLASVIRVHSMQKGTLVES